MLIGKNWKIESDKYDIILYKRHIPKTGKKKGVEDWSVEGYFSTTQAALRDLVRMEINGTGFKDFETVCQKIAELDEMIKGLSIIITTTNATSPVEPR